MRAKSIRAVEADPDSISQIEMKGRISDKRVYHIHGIYLGQSVQALSSIRFLKDPYVICAHKILGDSLAKTCRFRFPS